MLAKRFCASTNLSVRPKDRICARIAFVVVECFPVFQLDHSTPSCRGPSLGDLSDIRVLKSAGEKIGKSLRKTGIAAVGLGANGIEVHEPRLEESPRDRFQRLVHPPIQLDLVVQRAKDIGNGALF